MRDTQRERGAKTGSEALTEVLYGREGAKRFASWDLGYGDRMDGTRLFFWAGAVIPLGHRVSIGARARTLCSISNGNWVSLTLWSAPAAEMEIAFRSTHHGGYFRSFVWSEPDRPNGTGGGFGLGLAGPLRLDGQSFGSFFALPQRASDFAVVVVSAVAADGWPGSHNEDIPRGFSLSLR